MMQHFKDFGDVLEYARAFAVGYHIGLTTGVREDINDEDWTPLEQSAAKWGYDAGVAAYCRTIDDPEDDGE